MQRILASVVALTFAAGAGYGLSADRLEQSNDNAFSVAVEELTAAASAQGVEIQSDQVSYASLGNSFLVHAPIQGADKYTEADFAKGVNVGFLFTRAAGALPTGFYTVRATLPIGAREGQTLFIDASGKVVRKSQLLVRTIDQEEQFNPTPIDHDPPAIPNITSTHIYKNGKWYVDCAGWQPYRVIYYPL